MRLKLKNFIKEFEKYSKKENNKDFMNDALIIIRFFQHERLVHLIVTVFTGIVAILFLLGFLISSNIYLIILFIITLCLFIPYIFHYYYLENGVQRLYDLYYEIEKKTWK